jgi:ABC-type transport system involved in multi-copper enzyme maturation permease subunit
VLGPIFQREFLVVPRRSSHYLTRVAYLGALWVIAVTAWLSIQGWTRTPTLGESARFGPVLFQILTFVQLSLFLFFAALAAASAVAREKDRRTFILLLMTDLRNHEIVLGKMLGSLLPMLLLLVGSVPVLLLLLLLGGISLEQVLLAELIVGTTALAAGSLGGLVALWRDRTFQSLALTTLFLVLYLVLIRGLEVLPGIFPLVFGRTEGAVEVPDLARWQLYLDPFMALAATHHPPDPEDYLFGLSPAGGFAVMMLIATLVLNGLAVLRLRVWNPSGEPIMQREQPAEEDEETGKQADQKRRASAHAAPGAVRHVGANPILWREVYTRAYGRRPLLVKTAYFLVLALICYSALAPLLLGPAGPGATLSKPDFVAAYGMIPVGVLSLLLVTAQATTAITSERDTGALDLLLVTDLTPREFIFGKLLGILYNTKEFLLPPFLLAGLYGWYGCLATPPLGHPELQGSMNAVALLCVIGGALVLLSFATVLGVHVALRTPNSQMAIVNALSTIFFLTVGTLVTIALILINGRFEYQWGAFVFFLLAGVGGLWWVLSGDRPSTALTWASWFCPLAVLYTVMNILVGRQGSQESADPLVPFLVIAGAFGFTIAAMVVPLISEFDVAMGRTSGGAD